MRQKSIKFNEPYAPPYILFVTRDKLLFQELRQQDLLGLHHLQRLYAFGCSLESVEPLPLENLKILWLSGNRLTSLSVRKKNRFDCYLLASSLSFFFSFSYL